MAFNILTACSCSDPFHQHNSRWCERRHCECRSYTPSPSKFSGWSRTRLGLIMKDLERALRAPHFACDSHRDPCQSCRSMHKAVREFNKERLALFISRAQKAKQAWCGSKEHMAPQANMYLLSGWGERWVGGCYADSKETYTYTYLVCSECSNGLRARDGSFTLSRIPNATQVWPHHFPDYKLDSDYPLIAGNGGLAATWKIPPKMQFVGSHLMIGKDELQLVTKKASA